ncbi:MAG: phosphoribosylanthranilate isomerase, partial [Thiomargarita sp.]|nr:phosphoribosylanthranilate isomerase [Thiomargarita sp.]
VSIEQAQSIIQVLPAFITVVGLFVNAKPDFVQNILAKVPLDRLQFHGEETPEYCHSFAKPYIKALRMRADVNIHALAQDYTTATSLLLDTYVSGQQGGTGIVFDWKQIPSQLSHTIILAGGLTSHNVSQAIAIVKPYAVDVSGGVESAKGIKDADKIATFIAKCFQGTLKSTLHSLHN